MLLAALAEDPGKTPKSCIPLDDQSTACTHEAPHEDVPTTCPESFTALAVALVCLLVSKVPRSFMPADLDQLKACQLVAIVFDMPTTWPRLLMPKASL